LTDHDLTIDLQDLFGNWTFRNRFCFRTSDVDVRSEHPIFLKKSSLLG
jgi:hypothetical protein